MPFSKLFVSFPVLILIIPDPAKLLAGCNEATKRIHQSLLDVGPCSHQQDQGTRQNASQLYQYGPPQCQT